mgnify:CR=1 FL=1
MNNTLSKIRQEEIVSVWWVEVLLCNNKRDFLQCSIVDSGGEDNSSQIDDVDDVLRCCCCFVVVKEMSTQQPPTTHRRENIIEGQRQILL